MRSCTLQLSGVVARMKAQKISPQAALDMIDRISEEMDCCTDRMEGTIARLHTALEKTNQAKRDYYKQLQKLKDAKDNFTLCTVCGSQDSFSEDSSMLDSEDTVASQPTPRNPATTAQATTPEASPQQSSQDSSQTLFDTQE